jgi:hypothetical protein
VNLDDCEVTLPIVLRRGRVDEYILRKAVA